MSAFYRFFLLKADDHIARRREEYFADDARAIAAAHHVIADYPSADFPGVEIWCEQRKVVTLSRAEAARIQPPRKTHRAAWLINRNQRLLQQAARARRRTEALCAHR